MKEAVIVSTARTPIGKAYRGAFNNTGAPTLASHAIRHAVERAGVTPDEVDDVVMGCAMQQGSSGQNVARQSLLAAGLPVTVPGMTVDRQCSSGMMAIAIAASWATFEKRPQNESRKTDSRNDWHCSVWLQARSSSCLSF